MITAIFAVARNGVIGKDNDIPWRLPSDFKHFKKTTLGCPVIMGRKTWDSLPFKPLPKRDNYIVSRTMEQPTGEGMENVRVVPSLPTAIVECISHDHIFIIGGSSIYTEALEQEYVDRLIVNEIDADVEGDTFFHYDKTQWRETDRVEVRDDALPYDIVTYIRA